jgi:hypothetical protein
MVHYASSQFFKPPRDCGLANGICFAHELAVQDSKHKKERLSTLPQADFGVALALTVTSRKRPSHTTDAPEDTRTCADRKSI